jgi:hypothetical protein
MNIPNPLPVGEISLLIFNYLFSLYVYQHEIAFFESIGYPGLFTGSQHFTSFLDVFGTPQSVNRVYETFVHTLIEKSVKHYFPVIGEGTFFTLVGFTPDFSSRGESGDGGGVGRAKFGPRGERGLGRGLGLPFVPGDNGLPSGFGNGLIPGERVLGGNPGRTAFFPIGFIPNAPDAEGPPSLFNPTVPASAKFRNSRNLISSSFSSSWQLLHHLQQYQTQWLI